MNFPLLARSFIRNYLFSCSRMGRSRFKKLFRRFLPAHQKVQFENGLWMDLDLSQSNQEFIFWFYEELESSLQWAIKNLSPVEGTFVDCGANTGLMGLLAIHHRKAKTVFIEPHPRLAETIRKNIELNRFSPNATVFECAASDENGTAPLYLDSQSDGGHTLIKHKQKESGASSTILVQKCRLTDLLAESSLQHVDFLKIDTEGHDYQVLKGLDSFLNPRNIEWIHLEMDGDYLGIWNLLTERGYRPFASNMIYIDELRHLERLGDFSRFYAPIEKPGDGNLLWCARSSDHEKFLLQTCRA